MTFEEYILNPMGKKNAVMNATAREAIRGSYIKKYDAILLREKGKIDYTLYKDTKNNKFYGHFKIPSETVEKFYYDVVLEFYTDQNVESTSNLFKYNIKFYSNDPAFVYTYAYVFNHNNLFVDGLESRMSRKALTKQSTEKNPFNQVGYVKTIYFAYLLMKSKGLNDVGKFGAESVNFSIRALLSNIENADKKISDRESAGEKARKERAQKKQSVIDNAVKSAKSSLGIKTTKTTGKIKSIGSIKTVKRK